MNDSISRGELLFSFFIFGMLITMSFFGILIGTGLKAKTVLRYGLYNLGLTAFLFILNSSLSESGKIPVLNRFLFFFLSGISLIAMLFVFGNFIKQQSASFLKKNRIEIVPTENIAPSPEEINSDLLTEREFEVLRFTAEGMTDKEIADTLHLSVPTIKTHLRNIYHKLQVRNRVEATLRYKKILNLKS